MKARFTHAQDVHSYAAKRSGIVRRRELRKLERAEQRLLRRCCRLIRFASRDGEMCVRFVTSEREAVVKMLEFKLRTFGYEVSVQHGVRTCSNDDLMIYGTEIFVNWRNSAGITVHVVDRKDV